MSQTDREKVHHPIETLAKDRNRQITEEENQRPMPKGAGVTLSRAKGRTNYNEHKIPFHALHLGKG